MKTVYINVLSRLSTEISTKKNKFRFASKKPIILDRKLHLYSKRGNSSLVYSCAYLRGFKIDALSRERDGVVGLRKNKNPNSRCL